MGIRGEDIKAEGEMLKKDAANVQTAAVTNAEILGNGNNLYFTFGSRPSVAVVSKYDVARVGEKIQFVFLPDKMHFFDPETKKALS